jgi:hypothetical protein
MLQNMLQEERESQPVRLNEKHKTFRFTLHDAKFAGFQHNDVQDLLFKWYDNYSNLGA